MNAAAARVATGADVARAPGTRFVDPAVLSRIGNLALIARITVDGFVSGLHRTRQLGVSTEFAEHRGYTPGDDVRHIDWKVFARTDRLYVKCYESETNADVVFAVDVSGSMGYDDGAGRAIGKLDYARFAAASVARLAATQGDRVGLATFNDAPLERIPPSARHRDRVLVALENASAGGDSDIVAAMEGIGDSLRRRGIVCVLSDFYAPSAEVVRALDSLRVRGHDVIALHVLHPDEFDLSASGAASGVDILEDLESGERVPVEIAAQVDEYRRVIEAHAGDIAAQGGAHGIQYALFDTSRPLDLVLGRFLSARARLSRVR